jgi:hypothetical protein
MDVLRGVDGLAFMYFDETDVVRHQLVQRIVRAYDEFKSRVESGDLFGAEREARISGNGAKGGGNGREVEEIVLEPGNEQRDERIAE